MTKCRHVTRPGRQGLSSQKGHTGLQSSSLMGTVCLPMTFLSRFTFLSAIPFSIFSTLAFLLLLLELMKAAASFILL